MKQTTIPAAYARWMESVIATAVREARNDAAFRAGQPMPSGYRPLPDSFVDANAEGEYVVAVIALPTDEEQLRAEEWPNVPTPGTERFPRRRTAESKVVSITEAPSTRTPKTGT